MATIVIASVAFSGNWHLITGSFAPTTDGLAHATAFVAANDGNEIEEESKDVPRNVVGGRTGWYFNRTPHSVAQYPPAAAATVASQRQEVYGLLLESLDGLHIARLSAKPGAVEAASLRCRSLGAYVSVNTDNDILDALKAQAREDLNEFALASDTRSSGQSSWLVALRAPNLYLFAKPDPLVIGGLALPAADTSTGLIHPTQAALDAFDLRQALA